MNNKLKNISNAIRKNINTKYHIEQHFMLYSLTHLGKVLHVNDQQAIILASLLYDIPFPLTRIQISKVIEKNYKKHIDPYQPSKTADSISLVKLKYIIYGIAKKIFENSKENVSILENLDIKKKEANYYDDLSIDVAGLFKGEKICELNEFNKNIIDIIGYNRNKLWFDWDKYEEEKHKIFKKNNIKYESQNTNCKIINDIEYNTEEFKATFYAKIKEEFDKGTDELYDRLLESKRKLEQGKNDYDVAKKIDK